MKVSPDAAPVNGSWKYENRALEITSDGVVMTYRKVAAPITNTKK